MKKIIETLKTQVQILKESKDDMNAASWNYEEGVIITGNQAQKIIDELSRSSAGDYSTAPEWISTEEKLPNDGEIVINLVEYANELNIHIEKYLGLDEDDEPEWDMHATKCVKYWMPIPQEPIE